MSRARCGRGRGWRRVESSVGGRGSRASWSASTVAEDARGLRVIGSVDDPELARLVAGGAIDGLSIGYRTLEARHGARRELRRVALVEVSLVAQPMQPLARVHAVSG